MTDHLTQRRQERKEERITLQTGSIAYYQPAGELALPAENKSYLARFVRAGRVRTASNQPSNISIEAAALQAAVTDGLFDERAVFLDHAGLWEDSSLKDLIGATHSSAYNTDDQAVVGTVELYDTPAGNLARSIIEELLGSPEVAPDVGLSMVFYPVWEYDPETEERKVVKLKHVESVDLVFQPAADGRILQALSAWHASEEALTESHAKAPKVPGQAPRAQSFNHLQGRRVQPAQGRRVQSAQGRRVQPAQGRRVQPAQGVNTMPEVMQEAETQEVQAVNPQAEAWNRAATNVAARAATEAILSASGLPIASQQRLAGSTHPTPEALQAAIDAERQYLAALAEQNVIQVGGQAPRTPHITGGLTPFYQVRLAFEALMEGRRPAEGVRPLTGIREFYHLMSGDYEMTGVFPPERVTLANVTTSTMANLVANVMNKRVMNEFQEYPKWWEPIVIAENYQSLQQIKWINLGGIGELPTVAEGAAYTELTWDDSAETATFVKKGGYLGITLETIDKDDTGQVRAAPRALAQAAWLTLSKAISYIFTQSSGVGPTMSDSVALFNAAHSNVGASALSVTTYAAARLAMRKQTELNSSERLGALTSPRYLLVPPDLEITALQILASETDYTYALSNGTGPGPVNAFNDGGDSAARLNYARQRVIVVDLWTDTNDWAAVCNPRLYPTIGLGFRYGNTPEIFSVASPTAGLMFTNDTLPVKVRFFFAVAPIDYRGLYKANV